MLCYPDVTQARLRTGCVCEPKAGIFVSFHTVSCDAEKNMILMNYILYIYGKIDIQNIRAVTYFIPSLEYN